MLTRIHISNYRSIHELDLDLSYAEKDFPEGYGESDRIYFLEQNEKRFVPCLALYGANASGKSNILKGLFTLRKIVREGISGDIFSIDIVPKEVFDPNRLNVPRSTTCFEVSFIKDKKNFTYSIEYNAEEIVKEWLKCNGKILFSISEDQNTFFNLATESYPVKKLEDIYVVEGKSEKQEKTFLSVMGDRYPGLNKNLRTAYNFFIKDFRVIGSNNISIFEGLRLLSRTIFDEKKTESEKHQQALEEIREVLKKLDIYISRLELRQEKKDIIDISLQDFISLRREPHKTEVSNGVEKRVITNLISWHKNINGEDVPFNFNKAESNGTKIVVGLLGFLLTALKNGQIVVIDELDRSLHPILFVEVVRMFKDRRYNRNNAQLIFTAHDVMLLDEDNLGYSEIGIVSKNLKKGTTVKRLSDADALEKDDDIMRFYLDGEFGGRPYPYI